VSEPSGLNSGLILLMYFPSLKLRSFLALYAMLWTVGWPVAVAYIRKRAKKDPDYGQNLSERFGRHAPRNMRHIWVHAVSLGEMRSAVPLVRSLLDDGNHVVTTHFTPAGRREAHKAFGPEISSGQMSVVWVPFDYGAAFRRFFDAFRPEYGLVMEVEFWPGMIMAARKSGVPLMLCNGQYPKRSYDRAKTKWLSLRDVVPGFAGVMVKNDMQAAQFKECGQTNVAVTGELRFQQPIPPKMIAAAASFRPKLAGTRPVVTLSSVIEGEDSLMIETIQQALSRPGPRPLFVYVPRRPERFDEIATMIQEAGLVLVRRSTLLDDDLAPFGDVPECDVLFGDSLGEMYFYLGLCDRALIGGGFAKTSHNIIETLAMRKPVLVGPLIWAVLYPVEDAIADGVCTQVTEKNLVDALTMPNTTDPSVIDVFLEKHGTALQRTRAAIPNLIKANR
jgi:3-deoxy-D-manno-octulosonic-acid transferase